MFLSSFFVTGNMCRNVSDVAIFVKVNFVFNMINAYGQFYIYWTSIITKQMKVADFCGVRVEKYFVRWYIIILWSGRGMTKETKHRHRGGWFILFCNGHTRGRLCQQRLRFCPQPVVGTSPTQLYWFRCIDNGVFHRYNAP